jgi:hypothetical protein
MTMKTLSVKYASLIRQLSRASLAIAATVILSFVPESCVDHCESTVRYKYYEPIYTPLETLRSSVSVIEPQPVKQVGRIYYKAGYLFVNEPGEGIHIINNSNPSSPIIEKFLKIPGNYNLAVKGNTLYADSYIDLVLINISDLNNIKEVKRIENLFTQYNSMGYYADPSLGVVTDWREVENVNVSHSDCNNFRGPVLMYEGVIALTASEDFDRRAAIAPGTGSGPGVGGSMSRYAINQNHLFALDGSLIKSIDITNELQPADDGNTELTWDMETIFPYGNHLFIGSMSGMHIVDVSDPAHPQKVSTYEHVRVCDPVVVDDTLAYVTLRSGTQCQGFTNQLEVINISNLEDPKLLSTYPMVNPKGLGIDNKTLFICDGNAGLKIYDASDYKKIGERQLKNYQDINADDVIPFNGILMMIGSDGIYQYNYSDKDNITLLSKIAVTPG